MLISSTTKYFVFLLWICFVYFSAIFIFTSGFLLRRQVLIESNKTNLKILKNYFRFYQIEPSALGSTVTSQRRYSARP